MFFLLLLEWAGLVFLDRCCVLYIQYSYIYIYICLQKNRRTKLKITFSNMNIKHKRIECVRHSIHSNLLLQDGVFWRYISGTLLEMVEGATAGTNAFSFMLEMSGRGCTSLKKKKLTWTWKPKHARINFGGFNWMNPNHYMKNWCFTIAIHLKMVVGISKMMGLGKCTPPEAEQLVP